MKGLIREENGTIKNCDFNLLQFENAYVKLIGKIIRLESFINSDEFAYGASSSKKRLIITKFEKMKKRSENLLHKMKEFKHIEQGFRSAAPQERSIYLHCSRCNVSWTGCDDERHCEYCGYDAISDLDHPDNRSGKTRRVYEL